MNTYSITDQGRERSMNQDAFTNYFHPHFKLLVVCDGMGGHLAGDVASRMAVEIIRNYVIQQQEREDYPLILQESIELANLRIYEEGLREPNYSNMGTTVVAVLLTENRFYVAHVGDSRLYRMRDGILLQYTRDHSLVEDLLRKGLLSEEDAQHHPERNAVTRALGAEATVQVELQEDELQEADIFLLCTDGLTNMVDAKKIQTILCESKSAQDAAETLIYEANKRGGHDNITVTVHQVGGDDGTDHLE